MVGQRYMHRYGVTQEQCARVVVRSRRHAKQNPYAHLKGDITVDDVLNSPIISWPLRRFDICPRSSGAAALVVSDLSTARRSSTKPAFINGVSSIAHTVFMGDRMGYRAEADLSDHDAFNRAAQECYRQAGVIDPAKHIQIAEIYDPFSFFQFPQLESLGFCGRGEAARISDQGGFEPGGLVSVNLSGGTLCTNPIGVTGLVRVADAALQVMGCAGANQQPDVHNAVATSIGGSEQFLTCALLGDDHLGRN